MLKFEQNYNGFVVTNVFSVIKNFRFDNEFPVLARVLQTGYLQSALQVWPALVFIIFCTVYNLDASSN